MANKVLTASEKAEAYAIWNELKGATTASELEEVQAKLNQSSKAVRLAINIEILLRWDKGRCSDTSENPFC